MRIFKRLNATIQSNFNSFLDQIENHESLVTEAMHEVKTASAQATVRLARLQQDEDKLATRLTALRKEITQWKDRAVQAGTADEARALECAGSSTGGKSGSPKPKATLPVQPSPQIR